MFYHNLYSTVLDQLIQATIETMKSFVHYLFPRKANKQNRQVDDDVDDATSWDARADQVRMNGAQEQKMGDRKCVTGWWFGTWFIFPYIGNVIIRTDFHIFQIGRYTTNSG